MRNRATLAVLASVSLGALTLGAPAATASQPSAAGTSVAGCTEHWRLKINQHDDKGEACYRDYGNKAHADDQEKNGKSVVLVISERGGGGKHRRCWDHGGANGPGNTCTVNKWRENKNVRGRLCPAEWAGDKQDREIKWRRCTGFKKFEI